MADIDIAVGLNSAQFQAGLRALESPTQRAAARIANMLGGAAAFMAAKKAYQICADAARAYAESNTDAARTMGDMNLQAGRLQKALGEDVVGALDMALPAVRTLTDTLLTAKAAAVEYLAVWVGGEEAAAVSVLQAQNKEMGKFFGEAKKTKDIVAGLEAEAAKLMDTLDRDALGNTLGPEAKRALAAKDYAKTIDEIKKTLKTMPAGPRRDALETEMVVAANRANALRVARLTDEEFAAKQQAAKEQAEAYKARVDAFVATQNALTSNAIANLAANPGQEDAAKLLQIQADYAQQILKAQQDTLLTEEARALAVDTLNAQQREALNLARQQIDRAGRSERFTLAGSGSVGLSRAIAGGQLVGSAAGPSAGTRAAEAAAKTLDKINGTLDRLWGATQQGLVGVAG
jgi:hypothetical protein